MAWNPFVVAQLVGNVEIYEYGDGHSQRKTGEIDDDVGSVAKEVTPGGSHRLVFDKYETN
jgi:hypothetical protein